MKYLAAFLLAPVLAFAQPGPDPTKPVTNLLVEVLGGDLRAERPMVVQWWHDEDLCQTAAKALRKRFVGQRNFVCVRVLGEEV